ncbi:MAG: DNA repair protein RecO [Candidatus Wolfebacteria bacterium]|nr:DNA repair protein RecO [Candidatus Wolfebacteria bacterium]
MTEYFTEALVLAKKENGEADATVHLYSEKLGRVIAKAKGLKRIKSKLSAYLEPLNFINIRLVGNGRMQVVDALPSERNNFQEIKISAEKLAKFLTITNFINETVFEFQPDQQLWHTIVYIFKNNLGLEDAYKIILRDLGFDPQFAVCEICQKENPEFFNKENQTFLCKAHSSKEGKKELILIKV